MEGGGVHNDTKNLLVFFSTNGKQRDSAANICRLAPLHHSKNMFIVSHRLSISFQLKKGCSNPEKPYSKTLACKKFGKKSL
jgi:hypothetical protein